MTGSGEIFPAGNARLDTPPPRTVPQRLLLLTLVLSTGLLGWFTWHGFETYDMLQARREACLRSDQIRDRAVDLAHNLLILSQAGIGGLNPSAEARYHRTSVELDQALEQASRFERSLLGGADSSELEGAKRALDRLHRKLRHPQQSGDGSGAQDPIQANDSTDVHHAFHEAFNRYVEDFQLRFQHSLDAERRQHLIVVSITTVGFALCIAAWMLLVQWFRRNETHHMRELAERRAVESQARLLQKTELLGEIAGGIAHDVNNASTAIIGIVDLARTEVRDPQALTQRLDQIHQAIRQAQTMAGSLLRFGGHAPSDKVVLDFDALAHKTLPMLRGVLPTGIQLDYQGPPGPNPLLTKGNELELEQVIVNLLMNAKDALADIPQPAIRLRVFPSHPDTSPKGGMELVVEDNGSGMTEETRRRVFEPFFTTKRDGRGTGLGIPVVRRIVQEHEGRFWFDTAEGQGTRAHVWLPATDEPLTLPDDLPRQPEGVGRGTVLLAEDHPLVRQTLQEYLEKEGFSVIAAADGEQLLSRFAENTRPIDALVVDYDMPGRDGIDCLRELHRRGSHVPAILITGVADPALEEAVLDLALLLRKPFAATELARLLGSLTARRGSVDGRD